MTRRRTKELKEEKSIKEYTVMEREREEKEGSTELLKINEG